MGDRRVHSPALLESLCLKESLHTRYTSLWGRYIDDGLWERPFSRASWLVVGSYHLKKDGTSSKGY
jgi:hypothetical protein